ncbi:MULTISPECIES: hypothetical protein [unclassified Streptomyces]|uniref:hypothetical protein n=1 Tax=unclassified Streptomyces TaxID=2593676 RepID=UPI002E2A8E41|nr:hypothetical protein [Streptomyces sp. NBC_00228]
MTTDRAPGRDDVALILAEGVPGVPPLVLVQAADTLRGSDLVRTLRAARRRDPDTFPELLKNCAEFIGWTLLSALIGPDPQESLDATD